MEILAVWTFTGGVVIVTYCCQKIKMPSGLHAFGRHQCEKKNGALGCGQCPVLYDTLRIMSLLRFFKWLHVSRLNGKSANIYKH